MSNLFKAKNMTPVKIKHTNPFLSLQQELDKAMEDFYGRDIFQGLKIHPRMDIVDDKNNFKVEVEMPGMGEEDIHVSISNGVLTIQGEKSTSKKDENKNYVMREITYGNYERAIALPDFVDVDKATATFKKGMLWVVVPKRATSIQHAREVQVKSAQ